MAGSRRGRKNDSAGTGGAGAGLHSAEEAQAPAGPAAAEKGEVGSGGGDEHVSGAEVSSDTPERLDQSRDRGAGRGGGCPLVGIRSVMDSSWVTAWSVEGSPWCGEEGESTICCNEEAEPRRQPGPQGSQMP